ncbi:MAG TPA: hypothetical protein VH092_20320, partial [Urbifossiella sp.]|nr:hypothetical protein [Urbifossiella sp.]
MAVSLSWDPSGNAVHRLIQYLDLLGIAFHRFRKRSFSLPVARLERIDGREVLTGGPEWMDGRELLLAEFNEVRNVLFTADEEPRWQAERLANAARAELVRAGSQGDHMTVDHAGNWVGEVGTQWQIGAARPWRYYDEEHRMIEAAARVAAGNSVGRGR